MRRRRAADATADAGLRELVEACEAGLDLAGVLDAARRAASAALGGGEVAAYVLAEDGTGLRRVCGPGADEMPVPDVEDATSRGGVWIVPLVSARRIVGCLVAAAPATAAIAPVRLLAGVAAQAVEAARLWEAAASGAALDPLTGLPGHRAFDTALASELARARRSGDPVAVGVVEVDDLAARNEAGGHRAGDELLRTAARCFESGVRPYDTVCRLGGDDFGLLLPGMEADAARSLMERLAAAFAASTGGATVSAGVAAFPHHGDTQTELKRLVTGALYWARRGGGGRVVAYDADVVEALSAEEHARRLERDTYERTLRALEAARGHSASARAVSDYAGHLAAELGLTPERADRLRLAAFLYDATAPGAAPEERARVAARVAANALDAEAAGWLSAPAGPGIAAPLESRIIAVAAAFVEGGGHASTAGAGRALAELWRRRDDFDPACVRALEHLLAAREAPAS